MANPVTPTFLTHQTAQDIINIVAAIAVGATLEGAYTDKDGVVSWRIFRPYAMEKAKNGSAIVYVDDILRKDTRKYRLGMITSTFVRESA